MVWSRHRATISLFLLFSTSCGGAPPSTESSHRASNGGAQRQHGGAQKPGRGWPLAIQVGHAADVYVAAFSPDGALVATADRSGTIKLWDPKTGEVHADLEGHTANVTSLAFSPDGKRLASGGEDGRAFVWDLTRGTRLSVIEIPERKVWGVALSTDGQTLVVRDNIGLSVYRGDTGQEMRTYDHSSAAGAVLSPDGGAVVIGSGTNLQIMELVTGKLRAELLLAQPARQAIFSNDGRLVVVAGGDSHKITIFDATTGSVRREIATSGRVVAVALDDKAKMLAAVVENKGIELFDAQSSAPIATIEAKRASEWHFGMTSDGQRVFASDSTASIVEFDAHTGKPIARRQFDGLRRFVLDVAHGRVAALRDRDPTVDIWDGKTTATLVGSKERVRWAGLFPDGQSLAIVEEESPDIEVVSLATSRITSTLHTSLRAIYEAIPSYDGTRLFVTGYGEGAVLDAKTGREEKRFSSERWSAQFEGAWSRSGELAFVGLDDRTLYRFDNRLQAIPPLDIGSPAPTALAYSPDGSTLAMAGQGGVALLRANADQKIPLGPALGQPAYGLAWSADGGRIAIGSEKDAFTLTATAEKSSPDGQSGAVGLRTDLDAAHAFVSTAFSSDGTRLAAAERSGVIDIFAQGKVERSFHTHGTPWSVSFLPGKQAPVIIVAATSLGLVRLTDGAVVRIRRFEQAGKRVGLAFGLGAVAGDPAALALVKMRSTADVRSKVVALDPEAVRPGLGLELSR